MPFSQLVKLFRGVSQIFINLVGGEGWGVGENENF